MTDTTEQLLPCPFCGCKATHIKYSAGIKNTLGFDEWEAVACKRCRAAVGACDRRFRSRDDAKEAWNTRATQPQAATARAARKPLTTDQLFANDDLMALNAVHGMQMSDIAKIVRVIEAAHGIAAAPPVGIKPEGGE